MGKKKKHWYERETPLTERAGPIRVLWFPHAERLQLASVRTDPRTGKETPGLTFTLRLTDLQESKGAIKLLETLLAKAKQRSEGDVG